ncbi:MAG TPA: GH1 family beta-glucosidase [Ktedonobacterales bacterium]|jgi:beta-glucosidase
MAEFQQFPAGFLWGAATASFQIEGAANEDGKGPSIWDTFCKVPGAIFTGDTGDVACDHYHRYREDVALMQELGLGAYRLSISWPRIFPTGRGQVNIKGLDFYDRLVDTLLEAKITPFITLYHWDLPQALQDQGGWQNRETCHAFAEYAEVVVDRLGDRVQHWITHNEPYVTTFIGHMIGHHAPGLHEYEAGGQIAHHLLLSHGLALPAIRAASKVQAQVGITLSLQPVYPASQHEADVAEAAHTRARVYNWFLQPLFLGTYPEEALQGYDLPSPKIEDGDMELISAPIDFLGVNYYSPFRVASSLSGSSDRRPGAEYTEMGWEVYPEGLRDLLVQINQDYAPPALYVTENGAAFDDVLGEDGTVNDEARQRYLEGHLCMAHEAIQQGVPLKGYFVWSLLDNFEWTFGYSKRFGVVYVDYESQQRFIKQSGNWYGEVIARNGLDCG